MKRTILAMAMSGIFLTGCMTVDVEKNRINSFDQVKDEKLIEDGDLGDDEYIVHEKMKENDVQSAVV